MQTDTISPVTLFYTMEDFVRLKENVTHKNNTNFYGGHCGCGRMVVGFTTTYAISAYHH
jgi:hypothetical protein